MKESGRPFHHITSGKRRIKRATAAVLWRHGHMDVLEVGQVEAVRLQTPFKTKSLEMQSSSAYREVRRLNPRKFGAKLEN